MWHGASWNFIIWGLYFGLIVMIEKYTLLKVYDKIPKIFLHLYSIFLFTLGWGIFYFDDLGKMKTLFSSLFGNAGAASDFTVVILVFSVALLVGATNNPFLYFRF